METFWFEMTDIRPLVKQPWIPLAADTVLCHQGEFGCPGYEEEYFGAVSILVPDDCKKAAMRLDWTSVVLSSNSPQVSQKEYIPAEEYVDEPSGIYLVLRQHFDSGDSPVWSINQDFILAFNLIREGNSWLDPDCDYAEVARLKINGNMAPVLIEARAEYLHDYLNARHAGLLILTFRSRQRVLMDPNDLPWNGGQPSRKLEHGNWSGGSRVVHEGAGLFDGEWIVHRSFRTDVDATDPLPVFGFPTDGTVRSETFKSKPKGQPHLLVMGEMWRNEWLPPGPSSPRIRGDTIEPKVPFIIDHAGTRATTESLVGANRYLWFKPSVVTALIGRRGGSLGWYTEDTGSVGAAPHRVVHFGMNSLGLINVFAKDIGELSETHQHLWVPHNIVPDGGVCAELLAAQQACEPARTLAPEMLFQRMHTALHEESLKRFGQSLFRRCPSPGELPLKIHRFRSLDLPSLCTLAKDVTRFVSENLDLDLLKRLKPDEPKTHGSLKRLQNILASAGYDGRAVIGPLVGVNELRIADAHEKSPDLPRIFNLVGIQDNGCYPVMGKQLILSVANVLSNLVHIIPALNA